MILRLLLVVGVMTLAGCTSIAGNTDSVSPAAALDPARGEESPPFEPAPANATEPVRIEAEVTLGWIAGVGTNTFASETTAGLRTADQCPRAWFIVPDGATDLRIIVPPGTGLGAYVPVISWPDGVYFHDDPRSNGAEVEHVDDDPAAGLWAIEMLPQGATANQRWVVTVSYAIPAGSTAGIEFTLDPKCR